MSFAHSAYVDWNFWCGFTIAKCQDTTFVAMTDQFHCVAGGGLAGKGTPYLLAYAAEGMGPVSPCQVIFDEAYTPKEVSLCIGSWTLENILHGGSPARAFAAGDSLVVEIEGLDEDGELIEGKKVTFFLADYRSANETEWKLNNGWEKCDLSALGEVNGLIFTMKTSDAAGGWSNTALYFALDGLKIANKVADFENEEGGVNLTEPESVWQGADEPQIGTNLWTSGAFTFASYANDWGDWGVGYNGFTVSNQTTNEFTGWEAYRSACGGAYEGANFAVWNDPAQTEADITLAKAQVVPGFFINNTAYAVNSMCNGDDYAKKFGKDDWFKLTINATLNGMGIDTEVKVDLAADGEYINKWTYVDLSQFGPIDAIKFSLWSSDVVTYDGETYYMNTPAYFCMDNFGATKPAGYVEPERAKFEGEQGIEDVEAGVKAFKVMRNGQLIIVRGEAEFTVMGQSIK